MNYSLLAASCEPRANSGHHFHDHMVSAFSSKPQLENSIETKYHHPSTIMALPQLQRFLGQCTQTEQALVLEALHSTFAEAITRDILRNTLRSVFVDFANSLI